MGNAGIGPAGPLGHLDRITDHEGKTARQRSAAQPIEGETFGNLGITRTGACEAQPEIPILAGLE